MLFAGFDPGISAPGFGVVRRDLDRYRVVEADSLTTKASDDLTIRCEAIWDRLSLLLRTNQPSLLTIEEQANVGAGAWRDKGGFTVDNTKTHVTVGLALGCARAYRVPVLLLGARTIKVSLLGKGNANADKHEVQRGVMLLTGEQLSQARADAVAIAIGGAQRWKQLRARLSA